jgi:hypothetical protein
VRGASSLKLEGDLIDLLVEPVECLFIIQGGYLLIFEILSPSCGDQKKDMMSHCPKGDSEIENLWNEVEIDLCDGCIDLKFEASLFCHLDPSERAFERTFHFSKRIMRFCIRAIQADTDPLNP